MEQREEVGIGRKWCSGSFMHLDTRLSRSLRLLARSCAAKYYFESAIRRARGGGIMCSRVRTRARRYDNIFSRNSGYLRCTCFVVCGPRLLQEGSRKKRERERDSSREEMIFAYRADSLARSRVL